MEAFVSRKRRRLSFSKAVEPASATLSSQHLGEENESTDVKLAILASLHPNVNHEALLDILITAEGSVDAASQALGTTVDAQQSPRKRSVIGYQSSLSAYRSQQVASSEATPNKHRPLTKKGQTVHLYTPEGIAAHTPCSIIHNFLPPGEADDLLRELLEEAATFERQTFKVFDNVVQSPHTACFYVDSLEEQKRQTTEYLYNGSFLTVWLAVPRSKVCLNLSDRR